MLGKKTNGKLTRYRRVVTNDKSQSDKQGLRKIRIMRWNCRGFAWRKGPKLCSIPTSIDHILLVETWEHEGSQIFDLDGYTLFSICMGDMWCLLLHEKGAQLKD